MKFLPKVLNDCLKSLKNLLNGPLDVKTDYKHLLKLFTLKDHNLLAKVEYIRKEVNRGNWDVI